MLYSLDYNLGEYHVHIPLSNLNTVLLGDGNVGKTCLFNTLCKAVNDKHIQGNFLFINLKMLYNVPLIKTITSDYLVIIDNFDAVRVKRPEIVEYLEKYKPQTLIMGRDVFDLPCNKHFVFFVRCNKETKSIELKPLIPRFD